MTAMDKIKKKTSMIIYLTLVSHTYHHQIMHLSHVKKLIKENCIKTIGNASPVDQSETSFPRYFESRTYLLFTLSP